MIQILPKIIFLKTKKVSQNDWSIESSLKMKPVSKNPWNRMMVGNLPSNTKTSINEPVAANSFDYGGYSTFSAFGASVGPEALNLDFDAGSLTSPGTLNAHSFDNSIEFVGDTVISGNLTIEGNLTVHGNMAVGQDIRVDIPSL